jgi:hypothetical protein
MIVITALKELLNIKLRRKIPIVYPPPAPKLIGRITITSYISITKVQKRNHAHVYQLVCFSYPSPKAHQKSTNYILRLEEYHSITVQIQQLLLQQRICSKDWR